MCVNPCVRWYSWKSGSLESCENPRVRCERPPKSQNNQPGFTETHGKHMKTQENTSNNPGAAFGGAPKGAPPPWVGCCLCFHMFSMCFGKSWLIILAFWVAFAANKGCFHFPTTGFCENTSEQKVSTRKKGFHDPWYLSPLTPRLTRDLIC